MDRFACVVVGSGFGGTIAALTFVKLYEERNRGKGREKWDRVCILERGQWWVSHEIPFTPKEKRPAGHTRNMLEFLRDEAEPYGFWAHPDNIKGLTRLISMARQVNRRGLYDYRPLRQPGEEGSEKGNTKVTVLCASGVGGGSLVYANVTAVPPKTVWQDWPTERDGGRSLGSYFTPAEEFIGTNPITTVAGLTGQRLERSKWFHAAVVKAAWELGAPVLNDSIRDKNGNVVDLDTNLNLSITDVPERAFAGIPPQRVLHYRNPFQTNVCERQARCNLGCLPGARHTLNKRLFRALEEDQPLEVRPLCEATKIDYEESSAFPYVVTYRELRAGTDGDDVLEERKVAARTLVLAAGTLGTTELLLKSSKPNGTLVVSDQLGQGFSPDGDLLGYMRLKEGTGRTVDNTRGPINTSHALFRSDRRPYVASIEDTAISPMVANAFATFFEIDAAKAEEREEPAPRALGQRLAIWWRRAKRRIGLARRFPGLGILTRGFDLGRVRGVLDRLIENPTFRTVLQLMGQRFAQAGEQFQWKERKPERVERLIHRIVRSLFADATDPYASPAKRLGRFFIFSGMGVDRATGRLELWPDWKNFEAEERVVRRRPEEKLVSRWRSQDNEEEFEDVIHSMQYLATAIEKDATVRTPTWDRADPKKRSLVVLHPLGGCRMGTDAREGVVNGFGQVFRPEGGDRVRVYERFYVMDGSIIPGALGINSSLTIMAVALRSVEHAVEAELAQLPTSSKREAWDYWPVEYAASLHEAGDVSQRADAECHPLRPFPAPPNARVRTLPIVRQRRGAVMVSRAVYPTGAIVVWDDPNNPTKWIGELDLLPVRGTLGEEVRFAATEIGKAKGAVAWFL